MFDVTERLVSTGSETAKNADDHAGGREATTTGHLEPNEGFATMQREFTPSVDIPGRGHDQTTNQMLEHTS